MAVDKTLVVKGMSCGGCESRLRSALTRLGGVIKAEADFRSERVSVRFDPARISEQDIEERIRASGYDVA